MTNAAWIFLGVVWLSAAAAFVSYVLSRSPRRRKTSDELEASIAALRGRVTDFEDRLEHFVKREASRVKRSKGDDQPELPLGNAPEDRKVALSLLRSRVAQDRLQRGAL